MPDSTIEQVYATAAILLGDHDGEQFTPGVLAPYRLRPYSSLWRLMKQHGLPLPERAVHLIVPAYSTLIQPRDIGILDFSEAAGLRERAKGTQIAVSSIDGSSPVVVTTMTAHGLTDGTRITITGAIPSQYCGQTFVQNASGSTFNAPGLPSGLTPFAGGGAYVNVGESFVPMADRWPGVDASATAGTALRLYRDTGGSIEVLPCASDREVRLVYRASAVCPESGYLGVDDAHDYMAHAIAASAAASSGMPERAVELHQLAYGPSGEADGSGGLLREIVAQMVQRKNDTRRRPLPFRMRRDHMGVRF